MKKTLRMLHFSAFTLAALISTAQVTKLASNVNIQAGLLIGNKVIMVAKNDSIWVTDGTPGGTKKMTSKVSLDSNLSVVYFQNKIYFTGVTADKGYELWVTDGTDGGTHIVKDIWTGVGSSSPSDYFVYNDAIYFFAATSAKGIELWKSDGTGTGTALFKDINVGGGNSYDNSANFFTNNNILYFIANDGMHGAELWKTDETKGGTILLKDIYTGSNSSSCSGFTALGNIVLFSATDAEHGAELWKTNGTKTGTTLVKDIVSTPLPSIGSNPSQFLLFNGKIYFSALDVSTFSNSLWVTNGTTNETKLVKSMFPLLSNAVFFGDKFDFAGATSAGQNLELWNSDGTTGGTQILKDINTGTASSTPFIFMNFFSRGSAGPHNSLFNGKIFLSADDGKHGTELWITDGTEPGTKLVKDINPGTGTSLSTYTYFYTTTDLYFAANDGSTGNELWKSDGTKAGTNRVKDINPGTGGSAPQFLFTVLNNHLLFTANDGDNAKSDLFKLNAAIDTLAKSAITASPNIAPDANSFSIYPNPTTDRLSLIINSTNEKRAEVVITDQNGKQLYQQQLTSPKGLYQYQVNVKSLSPGLYYLQLITDKGVKSVKFIKN